MVLLLSLSEQSIGAKKKKGALSAPAGPMPAPEFRFCTYSTEAGPRSRAGMRFIRFINDPQWKRGANRLNCPVHRGNGTSDCGEGAPFRAFLTAVSVRCDVS